MASLNVALPDIARDTHASQTDLVWVIDAYSLAFASLLLIGGGFGDRYGRRMALIVGLLIFGAGSVVAMAATTATELIALRATLGLGAALVMPATLSTITSTFPESKRAGAVSIWAAVGGGAAILGLLASGALLAAFSWRSIFALNVVLALVAMAGTLRFVPESADPDAPSLDVSGAAIAVTGLVALIFSVIEAPTSPSRCWSPSSSGSCVRSTRCSTRASFATALCRPAACPSSSSSSPSSASRSSACSTCSSCVGTPRCSPQRRSFRWPLR
jgi:MFS family permease